MPGPAVRTDIVEVYVFRSAAGHGRDAEFLQLQRSAASLLPNTWQPVMGHVHDGEPAAAAALRELREETGTLPAAILGFWQLEEVNAFFLHAAECVMLSPGFAVRVATDWSPVLNEEHTAHRWVRRDHADRAFLWPGQRHAVAQIARDILDPGSPSEPILRIDPLSLLRRA